MSTGYGRGTNPASLANLEATNRTQTGAWSLERGKPLPFWLPWAEQVEALTTDYLEQLTTTVQPECHVCMALAIGAARARGAVACLEAAGREHAVPFATKGGTRKLWRDVTFWEDRLQGRLDRLAEHLKDHERARKASNPTAADYLKAAGS
jgi:hypothetical protein